VDIYSLRKLRIGHHPQLLVFVIVTHFIIIIIVYCHMCGKNALLLLVHCMKISIYPNTLVCYFMYYIFYIPL